MGFAESRNPLLSPPARARHCALVGGYMRREKAEQRPGLGAAALSAVAFQRPGRALQPSGSLRGVGAALLCGCELASPFLAKPIQMSFAGLGNPPLSPPARAPHCALVGGYMRKGNPKLLWGGCRGKLGTSPRQPSQAAVGPISYIAAFAWCPTVCRGTDDCGEHHPSTAAAPALAPAARTASGKTLQAQGNTPYAPRGGLCGCMAVRQTCSKPPGVPTGWGRLRAEPPGRASSWGA